MTNSLGYVAVTEFLQMDGISNISRLMMWNGNGTVRCQNKHAPEILNQAGMSSGVAVRPKVAKNLSFMSC